MYTKIEIHGLASGKLIKEILLNHNDENLNISLMEYLRLNSLPIASSCLGEGVCGKCSIIINDKEELSCLIKLKGMTNGPYTVKISYL